MHEREEGTITPEVTEQVTETVNQHVEIRQTEAAEQPDTVDAELDDEKDADEDTYIEVPYSRLVKIEKYKVSYALWDNCSHKTPDIRRLISLLSYLVFYTQLAKNKRGDKELKADIKQAESTLRDVYDAIFADMFRQATVV